MSRRSPVVYVRDVTGRIVQRTATPPGSTAEIATASLAQVPGDWIWEEFKSKVPKEFHTQSMKDQLQCHVFGAPTKSSWNLDAWNPAGELFTVQIFEAIVIQGNAACNAGGNEGF